MRTSEKTDKGPDNGSEPKETKSMMNKKAMIPVLIGVILAAAAAIGVNTFLGPCVHEDGSFGACHWAGRAMFAAALLIGAEGLAAICSGSNGVRRGLLLSMAAAAVMGICIPGLLISLCGMATMRCRSLMRPAMTILFTAMGIVSVIGYVMCREEQT